MWLVVFIKLDICIEAKTALGPYADLATESANCFVRLRGEESEREKGGEKVKEHEPAISFSELESKHPASRLPYKASRLRSPPGLQTECEPLYQQGQSPSCLSIIKTHQTQTMCHDMT